MSNQREEELAKQLKEALEQNATLTRGMEYYSLYHHLFTVSGDLTCIAGTDGFFKVINPAFTKILGYSEEELLKQQFLVLVHPDDFQNTIDAIQQLERGEAIINFENRYQTKSGSYISLQWMATPEPVSKTIYAIARDVTNIRKESQRVAESERLLRDAQRMAQLGSFEFTFEDEGLIWSEELFNIFEIVPNPERKLYDQYMERLRYCDLDLLKSKITWSVQTGNPYEIEHSLVFEDGREKFLYATAIPVKDKMGRVIKLRGIVQDITQKKREEEAMRNIVKEKEMLVKEIHHRVKNNLQVISSLLNLQANIIQDEQLKRLYADSQNRIKAMAAIHELLYKSDNFSRIDYAQYIHRLVHDLLFSLHGEKHEIDVELDLPPHLLDLDTAVPLGLMVNEIITNSLKHGIQKNVAGKIYIQMLSFDGGWFELKIGDSGPGFDFKQKIGNGDTLGLMLIESLALQLGGEINFHADHQGSQYTLRFRYSDHSQKRIQSEKQIL
jgi:PAS domain S-box-containing protein